MKKAKFLVEDGTFSLLVHKDGRSVMVEMRMDDADPVFFVNLDKDELDDLYNHLQDIKWEIEREEPKQ
jgi:hypothetical protein